MNCMNFYFVCALIYPTGLKNLASLKNGPHFEPVGKKKPNYVFTFDPPV